MVNLRATCSPPTFEFFPLKEVFLRSRLKLLNSFPKTRETKDIHWLNSTSSPEALSVERRGYTCLSISKKERISLKHSQSAWEDAVINLELRDTGNITLSIFHKSSAFLMLKPHVSCWQDMSHFFLNLLCVCVGSGQRHAAQHPGLQTTHRFVWVLICCICATLSLRASLESLVSPLPHFQVSEGPIIPRVLFRCPTHGPCPLNRHPPSP